MEIQMTTKTKTTLSLKIPPEVTKIMPWITRAKATGERSHIDWARREFEIASERAREREQAERELEERRKWREFELEQERRWQEEERQQALLLEQRRREEEERRLRVNNARYGTHYAVEDDGNEYLQPTQSSQKGWRRLLSEFDDLCDWDRYSQWGRRRTFCRATGNRWRPIRTNEDRRNRVQRDEVVNHDFDRNGMNKWHFGKKPRTPWFK